MKNKVLEKMLDEGWERVGYFGRNEIYKKGEDRILYNEKKDKKLMEYSPSKQKASQEKT